MAEIIVPKKWVHLFDAYGVIVDSEKAGMQKVERYKLVAPAKGVDPETMERVIMEYIGLLHGNFDLKRKVDIINALHEPMKEEKFSYHGLFYEDTLDAMKSISGSRDSAVIFSSKFDAQLQKDLAERIGVMVDMYEGRKTEPSEFKRISDLVAAKGGRAISHTADEFPELVAASKVGFVPENLIYVHRNDTSIEEAVREAEGKLKITIPENLRKTRSLREIDYLGLSN